jgi:hypothetical protein
MRVKNRQVRRMISNSNQTIGSTGGSVVRLKSGKKALISKVQQDSFN